MPVTRPTLTGEKVKTLTKAYVETVLVGKVDHFRVSSSTNGVCTALCTVGRDVWEVKAFLLYGDSENVPYNAMQPSSFSFTCNRQDDVPVDYLHWVIGEVREQQNREYRNLVREAVVQVPAPVEEAPEVTPAVEEAPELRSGDSYTVPAALLR